MLRLDPSIDYSSTSESLKFEEWSANFSDRASDLSTISCLFNSFSFFYKAFSGCYFSEANLIIAFSLNNVGLKGISSFSFKLFNVYSFWKCL